MKRRIFIILMTIAIYSAGCFGVIYYDDPLFVGIGARPIGMGKAFVAIVDDTNAIFLNPAGLGDQKNWELSTMNTNYLNEYQYTMFCGVNPTPSGVFGIGYVSSMIAYNVTGGGGGDFYNDAMVLSYGRKTDEFLPHTYGGASLKYYLKGFSGTENLTSRGFNVDLGVLYVPEKWISYGLNMQNVVFGSQLAGDLDSEDMPFNARIGAAFYWMEHDVKFALDKDMYIGRADFPWPMHLGAEWKVHRNLYLRAGYDQVMSSGNEGGLANNMSFGVGFEYSGIKVDLAYMQNHAETNTASNVISLSFFSQPILGEVAPARTEMPVTAEAALPKPAAIPAKNVADKIVINPAGGVVTVNTMITFSGNVDFDVTDLWVGGKKLQLRSDRAFATSVPLSVGSNDITIKVRDINNSEADIKKDVFRSYVPADLSLEEAESMELAYKVIYTEIYNYMGGKGFSTNKTLSREILALIIAKAKELGLTASKTDVSTDVSAMYWNAAYIRAVKSAGIMSDFSDGMFRPGNLVSKSELAAVMSKATGVGEDSIITYLAPGSPEDIITMKDLAKAMFYTGILAREIDGYKSFAGF